MTGYHKRLEPRRDTNMAETLFAGKLRNLWRHVKTLYMYFATWRSSGKLCALVWRHQDIVIKVRSVSRVWNRNFCSRFCDRFCVSLSFTCSRFGVLRNFKRLQLIPVPHFWLLVARWYNPTFYGSFKNYWCTLWLVFIVRIISVVFVVVKKKIDVSFSWFSSRHFCSCCSRSDSRDNGMIKFIVNNRTDARKTDIS